MKKNNPVKILIVDDHPIVRQGIGIVINQEDDLTICGESRNANEAIRAIASLKPDIVIVDITLEGDINGIDLVKAIKERFENVHTLVLSMHDESLYAERAVRAGANGYIMKKEAPKKIITAIRKILMGKLYLSDNISEKILDRLLHGVSENVVSSLELLSDRELEIFKLIGGGLKTSEISKKLSISVNTVESHRRHIKEKLNIRNSSELIRNAVQWVLTENK